MATTVTTALLATCTRQPKKLVRQLRRPVENRKWYPDLPLLSGADSRAARNILVHTRKRSHLVFITTPQGAHDLLVRDDGTAERAVTPMSCELRNLIGDNLIVVPHLDWARRRRALQPIFAEQQVPRFAGHMAELAQQVARRWADGTEVDLDSQCRALTLRALGRSVLGAELDGRTEMVGPALRTTVKWVGDRAVRPINLPRWLPTPGQRRARGASVVLHELATYILQACGASQVPDVPLVRAMMRAADPQTGEPLSNRAICDELVSLLIAGHGTTSSALSYAMWALGQHQDLQERVAIEVGRLGDRQLTHQDVPRLSYTVQVLHEALRLSPPVPAVGRFVMKDIEVDGRRLQAGTHAVVAIHAIHRDPALWEDPLKFDPDRFSPERSAGRSRWQYLPFGGGPRACIGNHFAMLEATLALATIIRQIEIRSLDDFPTITPFIGVAAGPIRALVRQRKLAVAVV